ncbi:MAG: RHS repeat-associated core domain-containing protein, partial [Prevotella sp.]|nr:RHS repeat-associated core domain-containing protein [Prevotella sp.]
GNRVWYISDYDYYANGNDLYVIDSLGTGQNGLARTTRYDDYGNLSTIIMTRQNSTLHAMTFYHDRFTGNLTSRSGMLPNDGEVFTYDPLDRLVRYQDDGSHWDNIYQYTHDGNIQYKTGIGYYDYQPTSAIRPHAVKRVENLNGKVPTGRSFVTYNDLGKASSLYDDSSPSSLQYDITYGPDGERWESSLYRSNYQWPDTVRRYVGDMEIVSSGPSEVCRFYYLGHGVVLRKVNDTVTPLYAFTDNLGSITRLYTANGTEKFNAQYDPWGMQIISKNDVNFARGYCGHEMLNDFQLINMNGRMYDPVLGRFLSPDNYVQMPTSAQSFNRYSYCLNNPLKYTDPSGELFGIDDAVFAFALYNMANSMMMAAYNGQSVLKAGGLSLLSSAASYGIGSAFGGVGSFGHELLRAGSHGFATGAINALNGDSFGRGFLTGSLSSGIGSFAQGVHMDTGLMLASTTAMGGLSEWATGGDFLSGAMQGLQIGLLNHAMHGDGDIVYTRDSYGNIEGNIPEVVVRPDYGIATSFWVGTFGTAFGVSARQWKSMKTATKSKIVYDGKKFVKNHTSWKIQSSNAQLYRNKIPNGLKSSGKFFSRLSVGINIFENYTNIYENNRVGLGNMADFALAVSSTTGIGAAIGVGYVVADYMLYRYTGKDIRQRLNNSFYISW